MLLTLYKNEFKSSLLLAIPLSIAMLAQVGIGVVDSIMMGYLGPTALAAGALALGAYFLILMFCFGMMSAVGVSIAQAYGADDSAGVCNYLQQGGYFICVLSIPVMLLIWNIHYLFPYLKQNPLVIPLATQFMHGLMWGYPGLLSFVLLRDFSASLDKPRIVMCIALLMLPLNAILDYGFIFGCWGFPKWGMFGVGFASSIVQWFSLLILLPYVFFQKKLRTYVRHRLLKPNFATIKQLWLLGTPIGTVYFFEAGLFTVASFMIGHINVNALAAHQVVLQCVDVAFMFILGFGQATSIRVARNVGNKQIEKAKIALYVNLAGGVILASVFSILFFNLPVLLVDLFINVSDKHNPELLNYAIQFFKIAVVFVFLDASQLIISNALRGLKDTFIPMLLGLSSYWILGIGSAWIFGFVLHLQGLGVWLGLSVGIGASAMILAIRWRFSINRYARELLD